MHDHKKQQHQTEIGQKVTVDRDKIQNELAKISNAKLRDIGDSLNPIADTLNYKGSMAVHIYESPILKQIFFITQTDTMQDVNELTASSALSQLRSDAQVAFGRNRQVKRSGF